MKQVLKQKVRNAFRKRGWDIVKTPNLNQFLHSRNVDLVIDAGANIGDYGVHLRRWGYSGAIVSIEPASGPYRQLQDRLSGDRSWTALNIALGAEEGEARLNISEDTRFSSVLKASDLADIFDPKARVVATETVPVETLDRLLADRAFSAGFLKIDTQGFERQVLEGAKKTLKRCVGVQLELPIGHLYEDVWSFRDALGYMDDLGFVLAQNVPTNPYTDDPASVLEFDCVFRRKREDD